MYAEAVFEYSTTQWLPWAGPTPARRFAAPLANRAEAPVDRFPQQRCYVSENGKLRDETTHDPRLRYPHSYTRRDILIALAAAED
ncbi:hypothetical protein [Streptacidiphilus rugosus]|uniref:hypothetical protein n=1 Tax=Streptacidiphilus rugosus TaxID=405783 RepID=UPI00055D027D|nr:hypothetical protein [Streptacidiphilus rugosus]